jgi:hypothetical protein
VVLGFDAQTGAITCFGSIPDGADVRVCAAGSEQLLQAASSVAKAVTCSGFTPAAAIVISCVGRKWQLNNCGEEEVQAIQKVIGHQVPLIGFPSFGEMGPFFLDDCGHSEPYFHNATCVICLLGA